MMLLTPDSIQDEIDRLEIRYLANTDSNLHYALLSDYSDAPGPNMPEDAERLNVAMRGIEQLNAKYPPGRFLLFHRERAWERNRRPLDGLGAQARQAGTDEWAADEHEERCWAEFLHKRHLPTPNT